MVRFVYPLCSILLLASSLVLSGCPDDDDDTIVLDDDDATADDDDATADDDDATADDDDATADDDDATADDDDATADDDDATADDDDATADDDDATADDDDATADDDDATADDDDATADDDDATADDDDATADDDDATPDPCLVDIDGDGVTVCGPDGVAGGPDDDCDDNDAANFPGNAEVCDAGDNDCNGLADFASDYADWLQADTAGGGPAFAPITLAASTPLTLTDDELSGAVPIGFTFEHAGQPKTELFVRANGFVGFDGVSHETFFSPSPLGSTDLPNDFIAMWWNDLNPETGGTIAYETTGVAPDRVFVLEFDSIPYYNDDDDTVPTAETVSFQLQLFEGGNEIQVHYVQADAPALPAALEGTTVGVENLSGEAASVYFDAEVGATLSGVAVGWLPSDEVDSDGDLQPVCDGDCDDEDAANFDGNVETCDDTGDNDCDAAVDCADLDCFTDVLCPTLYAVDGANTVGSLYEVDVATGATTEVGATGEGMTGIAFAPDGTLYGSASGSLPLSLWTIDAATGLTTEVGPFGTGHFSPDLTFVGTTLLGWTENGDDVCTIDTATGVLTPLGDSGLDSAGSGMAADASGTVWFIPAGDELYNVDATTGAVTLVTAISGLTGDTIAALAWSNGVLYGIDKVWSGTPGEASLVSIDPVTGVLTTIGALPPDVDALAAPVP